uniref:Uncharacterized protein n=1 Tax=Brassica campestris TaxID=3711 RepID=M4D7B9_BRACM
MYCCIMHGRLMDQKILDGNTEVAPVATRVHVNGLKEGLRGLFPLPLIVATSSWRQEKKTRKMHISFCETPSNVSVNDSELESDMNATTPIYSKGKYIEIIREVFSYLKKSTSPSGPQISPSVLHSRMFKGCIGTVPVGRVEPGYGCHLCTLASVLDMIRDGCVCGATLWMRAL